MASTATTRPGRSVERRAVVKGAVTGAKTGPTGAAAGAARGAVRTRSAAPAPERAARPAAARTTGTRKRSGFGISGLDSPASGALFAEYFGGVLIISLELFSKTLANLVFISPSNDGVHEAVAAAVGEVFVAKP